MISEKDYDEIYQKGYENGKNDNITKIEYALKPSFTTRKLKEQQNEIERLNNIINEFEKWLDSEIDRINKLKSPKKGIQPYGEENYYYENMILRYKECKNKLKELKGVK